ncbi:unnamed protein product [Trichobilharzia regenti]|nr:unnamed protein product [Trichobilharzia regenti]
MEHIHDHHNHHHHHNNYGSYNHRKTPTVIAVECAGEDGDKDVPTPNHHHNQVKSKNKLEKVGDIISVHCETSNEGEMNHLPTYDVSCLLFHCHLPYHLT